MSENRPIIIALAIVGLLIVGSIVYSVSSKESVPEVVTQPVAIPEPEPPAPEPVIEAEPEPELEPEQVVEAPVEEEVEPAFVLPRLNG